MLSIFAPHFFNWTQQLKDSGHEIYWLDIFDSNTKVQQIDFVHQIVGWRYRYRFPGRYYLKAKAPQLTSLINKINQRDLLQVLEEKLQDIKPDVVHSFVMYLATAPVYQVMKKHDRIKWVYSSWGSDLYFYRRKEKELRKIKQTLPAIDFMFSDCMRDFHIAVANGFRGKFLGSFPGGGGFDFNKYDSYIQPLSSRNTILVKGYQGLHGRCIEILKALWSVREELKSVRIKVFGASQEVINYWEQSPGNKWELLEIYGQLPHTKVMEFMGEAKLYIGNSHSDGIPNTLLEAFIMGAFPIQSNPGGATAEYIEDGKNGYLIENPEDETWIAELIMRALSDNKTITEGAEFNLRRIKPELERQKVRSRVLEQYRVIEKSIQ